MHRVHNYYVVNCALAGSSSIIIISLSEEDVLCLARHLRPKLVTRKTNIIKQLINFSAKDCWKQRSRMHMYLCICCAVFTVRRLNER